MSCQSHWATVEEEKEEEDQPFLGRSGRTRKRNQFFRRKMLWLGKPKLRQPHPNYRVKCLCVFHSRTEKREDNIFINVKGNHLVKEEKSGSQEYHIAMEHNKSFFTRKSHQLKKTPYISKDHQKGHFTGEIL